MSQSIELLETFIECPHCFGIIEIIQLNCAIFRHAYYKNSITHSGQVPPHTNKVECERLIKEDLIYGCCKPFKIVDGKPIICDYI